MARGVRWWYRRKREYAPPTQRVAAFHGETDSHACLLILAFLLCRVNLSCQLLTRLGPSSGVQFFISFHSGSLHERWSTPQGAQLDMNAIFIDIIRTLSKACIVQISPPKRTLPPHFTQRRYRKALNSPFLPTLDERCDIDFRILMDCP